MSSNHLTSSTVSRYSPSTTFSLNSLYLGNDDKHQTYRIGTTASGMAKGGDSVLPQVPLQSTNSTEADSKTAQATPKIQASNSSQSSLIFKEPLGAAILGLGSLIMGALFSLFRSKTTAHA